MPTNFPGGFDTFNEPTIPEETTLSSAGTASRNHTEHHRDLGDAVEAIEHNVARSNHDHGGGTGDFNTPKLDEANTHEHSDADQGTNSRHHTLGTNPNQAAAGDHLHPQYTANYRICTSTSRPASPWLGLQIFETDTGRTRIWAQFAGQSSPGWRILPVTAIPAVRLRQSLRQQLAPTGTIIQWQEEVEDSFNFFNPAAPTDIVMKEAGLYQVEAAIQWDPQFVPDVAHATLCLNGVETTVRNQQFLRGNVFEPGFSQTLQVAGKIRVDTNDVLTVKTTHVASGSLLLKIFSFFDIPSKINSRIDVSFLTP